MNWQLKTRIIEAYGTQADFSHAIDEGETTVSKVIRGRRVLSKEKQEKWAKTLDCEPGDIFHQSGDSNDT